MPIDESGTNLNNHTPADPIRGRHAAERSGPELVPLPGSNREAAPRALSLPAAGQAQLYGEDITVTVVLRRAVPVPLRRRYRGDAGCPMWLPSPTRRPATGFGLTEPTWSSAAPAPSHRCGRP